MKNKIIASGVILTILGMQTLPVLGYTKDETVYIPACVTHGNFDDLVYNDFYVGKNADVTIVAGCGVHTDTEEDARHNGIHKFILEQKFYIRKNILEPEKVQELRK